MIHRTEYDDLQRRTKTIEACGTDAERTQRYRWHASGQMEHLILENPDTGEQVTTWVFGSTLAESDIARNDVVVAKRWPTGETGTFTVNRQREATTHTQPNGTVHEYTRNQVGQMLHDAVTTLGADIDDGVLRMKGVNSQKSKFLRPPNRCRAERGHPVKEQSTNALIRGAVASPSVARAAR